MNLFVENVRLALASLLANKSRALLTMLGIVIGISSVIAIMTVGNSLSLSLSSEMQAMGANNINVMLKGADATTEEKEEGIVFGEKKLTKEISEDDYITDDMIYSFVNKYKDSVEAISVAESLGMGVYNKGKKDYNVNIYGVSLGYFLANNVELESGNTFSLSEYQNGRNVIILSSKLVDKIFDEEYKDVLGKDINVKINNQYVSYTIIGVYKETEDDYSQYINDSYYSFIPLTTAKNFVHSKNYSSLSVVTKVRVNSDDFASEVKEYFNAFYRNNPYIEVDAFSMTSLVDMMGDMMGTITTAISVIAGIALLVGGIGVMNIMLVSITERTREIGTRKALGAKNSSIRTQFIIEAMIMCLIGGVIGVILGLLLGALGAKILGYAAAPSISSILVSLLFSLGIGLFFGFYPANKAAKMNPIDALRYE